MVPVCLVTGFLGCGKTTFLKKIIEREQKKRIVYLINEFASIDIDGELVGKNSQSVVTVPGGSIFCKCLVGEFIRQMRMIVQQFHSAETPLDGVIIEASGMANPTVIFDMLDETGLKNYYKLSRVISVVDPRSLLILLNTLPNIKAQIKTSDVILLNKTDIYPEDQIQKTEETILSINKTALLIRTAFCDISIDLFPQAAVKDVHGEYAKCKDPLFDSFTRKISRPIDLNQLKAKLEKFRSEIYRLKGFIPTEEGYFYLDFSQAGLSISPAGNATSVSAALAFIVKGQASSDLTAYINSID